VDNKVRKTLSRQLFAVLFLKIYNNFMLDKPKVNLDEESLQAIADLLDKQTAVLAKKEELLDMKSDLKDYMNEGFEMVMDGLGGRVDKLEKDVKDLKLNRPIAT